MHQIEREKAWAERRAAMEHLRVRREEKLNLARREYLRVLNEDVMSWNHSPSELEFARYRIVRPERFKLFNN
jgi:hypothetical protein